MSRRALQIVTGLLGVIPLATGCIGLLGLRDPLYVRCGVPVGLDSNLRFYSGLWLGLGIAMYSILPSIERQTVLFRAFWGAIFLGGLGRLASIRRGRHAICAVSGSDSAGTGGGTCFRRLAAAGGARERSRDVRDDVREWIENSH